MLTSRLKSATTGTPKITLVGITKAGPNVSTLPLPSGLQANDFVLFFGVRVSAIPSLPTGYTGIVSRTSTIYVRVAYKFMGSTPDTSVTVDNSTSSIYIAMVFRGVNTTNPFAATSVLVTGTLDPQALIVSDESSIICAGINSNTQVLSAPSGYTLGESLTGAGGTGASLATAYLLNQPSGTYNPSTFTGATAVTASSAVTIALKV